eukprot:jgi/Bigna1/130581/aug1.11_g5289
MDCIINKKKTKKMEEEEEEKKEEDKEKEQVNNEAAHDSGGIEDKSSPCYWFLRAAEGGDIDGMRATASCYKAGKYGVKTSDYTSALHWLRKAQEAGDMMSTVTIAQILYDGEGGVAPNCRLAARLYKFAAQKNNPQAQVWLGACYQDDLVGGFSYEDDHEEAEEEEGEEEALDEDAVRHRKAFKWLQLAAENGEAEGMYRLGLCYLRGEGVNGGEDISEGRKWLFKASERGFEPATDHLRSMGMIDSNTTKIE